MTVFLFTAMVVLLLATQLFLAARRRRAAARARAAVRYVDVGRASNPSGDALFHPGHTWVQIHGDRLATIGANAFAANFAGELRSVETPAEGTKLDQAAPAWTLVSARGRRLELPMPIAGEVLAVNADLCRDPGLLQRRPYDQGWVLRIKPRRIKDALRNLLPATAAEHWIDSARSEVTARAIAVPGAVAFDGGEWSPAFGDRLTDRDWYGLRRDLFPACTRNGADVQRSS